MKKFIIPDLAYCKQCKTRWDLSVLRTRKDYKPGMCPKCNMPLKSIKTKVEL